jgi:putative restriction endonuclease
MAKAVLATKVDPTYDDLPEERYHFPRTYLRQVEAALGDWIVYYEPRRSNSDLSSRGGRQAYFATARITRIEKDTTHADQYYAFVAEYLEFDHSVPFREGGHYYEAALQREDGATNKGAFGRAVRTIQDREYDLILHAGFTRVLGEMTSPVESAHPRYPGFAEDPPAEFERPIVERVVARPFRDAAFAAAVKAAYGDTCAMTGLKIINGGGRSEVQAAHIRPIAQAGPDSVRNGLALCGTVHWMFDRGLISIDDDLTLLVARSKVPETVRRLLNPDGMLKPAARHELLPHPQFLRYHRDNIFKG